ncbi:hypothetical protein [Coleofasciculus sp. FACHB-129]|uniref:hypothetical protein n=1 Tax=Coleofasciculus sp. FACHB-129 TaxID=2692785 RepID=UPI001A7EEC87|nr:hypothetical protein [Coleofasciculus sp. FACHB-129]
MSFAVRVLKMRSLSACHVGWKDGSTRIYGYVLRTLLHYMKHWKPRSEALC